jgi:hypothetical protein
MKKAISIRQPYAWCAAVGLMPVECRTWSTDYRGPVLIHAGQRPARKSIEQIEAERHVTIDRAALQYGGFVGCAEIYDVVTHHPSLWFLPGHFGFLFRNARVTPFLAWPGRLNLFEVPDDVAARLD